MIIYLAKKKKNELYHHGILGQKWGVRRYQNADGSLTAAGKARYGVSENLSSDSSSKKLSSYQKVMRKLGGSTYAKRAIVSNKYLNAEQMTTALKENAKLSAK